MSSSAITTTDYEKFREGTLANRPAANAVSVGTYYLVADGGTRELFRSDGTSWERVDAVPDISARAKRGATVQSIPDSAISAVSFDTEEFDSDAMFDLASPTVLTIKTAGLYVVQGYVRLAGSVGGSRRINHLMHNSEGVAVTEDDVGGSSATIPGLVVGAIIRASVNDTLRLDLYQNSGAALNCNVAYLGAARIAP